MMCRRIFVIFFMICVAIFSFQQDTFARRKGKDAKFKHVDRNKDGVIDKKEWHMEKRLEKKQRTKVNNWWRERADVDSDGLVSDEELKAWKELQRERIDIDGDGEISSKERRMCWRHARSRVNTEREAKHDKDGDGWLSPDEVRDFMKDRCILIKTKGKAKVDSALEEEYDVDKDGIIDSEEAETMEEDLAEEEE